MKYSIADIIAKPEQRFLAIAKDAINVDARTVSLAFSSEEPVEFYFGFEILDHSPGACDLSLLNDGAALMDNHRCLIGKIEAATTDADRVNRAVVRFSKAAKAEEMFQDVIDEIRTKTSVGYRRLAMVLEKTENGVDTYRTTKWQPYEISLADVPADSTVGVGRSKDLSNNQPLPKTGVKTMDPEELARQEAAAKEAQRVQMNNGRTAERTRIAEIDATAKRFADRVPTMDAIREKAVNEGWDESKFAAAILDSMPEAKRIDNPNPNLGMGEKDLRTYSIVKAVRTIAAGKPLEGIEGEASREYAKLAKRDVGEKTFIIPNDVMVSAKRALSTQSAAAGGYTVGTQVMTGEMIELLRNRMLTVLMGARVLSGLVGNIAIPKIAGGASVYWLPSNGEVTESGQSFGQLGLTPHRLIANTAYDKELMNQSSISIEDFVRDDLMRVCAIEKDRAAINGSGANGEPIGLLSVPSGVGTVTFSTAATWAKILEFETAVATANADSGSLGYMTTPAVRGKLKGIQKASALPFIWEKGSAPGMGEVNGYPAGATNQVPLNKVIFGNWVDMVVAEWAGIDVVVDPYSLAKKSQIQLIVTQWADIGVRHPGSFAVSTDAGNQ